MHSAIIRRSKYFATAVTTDVGNANPKSEMEVKDCAPEILTCVVDYMYGNPVPEHFAELEDLLRQADYFMMEDLKSAVGLLIAKTLNLDTVKDLVVLGEKYQEVTLQESCSDFILAHIEEIEDSVLSELELPLIARKSLQAVKDTKRECEEEIATALREAKENMLEAVREGLREGLHEALREGLHEGLREALREGLSELS